MRRPFAIQQKKLFKNLEKRFQFSRNSAIYKTGEYSNALTEANILNKKNNLNYTTGQGRSTLATLSTFKLLFSLF